MSKKSFEEWDKDYNETYEWYIDGGVEYREKEPHKQRREAWEACASQCKSEIEGLKLKFSEATKTYTDDIDRLEKENEGLEKKLEEAIKSQKDRLCQNL